MKKMHAAFENLFSGGKAYEPTNQSQSSPVTITSYSQPDVLRKKMEDEKLSHGGTVTANLSPVRLDMDHGGVVMYFCPMKTIQVLNVKTKGDGGIIPVQAKIEGLSVPSHYKSGFYELKNVEVTSNGAILVKATEETIWERVASSIPG
ncbi:MAG TPA: hypothetical protein VK518_08940 [Puia sp.]|nr:hypothetical protein [Puia sp.]